MLDVLRISRATLVGLSAGLELAVNFAIVHPDRVAGLVLASPGLGGYRGSPLPWMQPVFDAVAAGDAEYLDKGFNFQQMAEERKVQLKRISTLRGNRDVLVFAANLMNNRQPVAINYSDLLPLND